MTGCSVGTWPQSQNILPHGELEKPLVDEGLQVEDREEPLHSGGGENWLLTKITWVQILILPPVGYETWDKLLHLSKSQFLCL